MDTRQLASAINCIKGFDPGDRHLSSTVAYRIVQALRMQEKRGGKVARKGKRGTRLLGALTSPEAVRP